MSQHQSSDEERLEQLGYKQEFKRGLSVWGNFAVGFTYLSPVVAVYSVFGEVLGTGGPPMIWALVIAGIGQLAVAIVYGEVVSQYPLAGGVYPWTRRLWGRKYSWMSAWIYLVALEVAVTSVAFGAGPFLAIGLGIEPSTTNSVIIGIALILIVTLVNLGGSKFLAAVAMFGFGAEICGAVVIGVVLLSANRVNPPSVIFHTFGAGHGSYLPAFLTAGLIGVWLYNGFEACGDTAEEVPNASKRVPKTMRWSIYVAGAAAIFVCFALILAVPNIGAVVSGQVSDPVNVIFDSAFGVTGTKFVMWVLVISFFSCVLSVQAAVSRLMYASARDHMLPGSTNLAKVSHRTGSPYYAVLISAIFPIIVIIIAQFAPNTLTYVVSFTILGFYLAFQAVVLAALRAKLRGWKPQGSMRLGKKSIPINIFALIYGAAAIVNLAWPRTPGSPWYQNYLLILSAVVVIAAGAIYMAWKKPYLQGDAPAGDAIPASKQQTPAGRRSIRTID